MNTARILLFTALLAGCATTGAPSLDGKVGASEWSRAQRFPLSPAGTVSLLRRGDTLHVAVDGPLTGIASVLLFDGEKVHVLHASAALGTAVFERRPDGRWQATQHFQWEARDPNDGAAREGFREKHGWMANVIPPGQNTPPDLDREFTIDLKRFRKDAPLRLAAGVLHITAANPVVEVWPGTLKDGAAELQLHRGDTSVAYAFTPERWYPIGG